MKKFSLFFCITFTIALILLSSTVFAETNRIEIYDTVFTYDQEGNVIISDSDYIGKYHYDEFLSYMEEGYSVTSIKLLYPICEIAENAFSGSSNTLESVDIPSSVYLLQENIFGEEHNVKIRYSGNEELWQDISKANDDAYYGDIEFFSRGYAGISDAYFTVTEDGIVLDLVYSFVEKDCVAEIKIYSLDENGNRITDKTYTLDAYADDDPGYNYTMSYNLDFVPDGKTHPVSITLYNDLTNKIQWGDVYESEFTAYNTPCACENVNVSDYDSQLTCSMNFAFVREDSVAHIEIFDFDDEGNLVPDTELEIEIPAGTTYLKHNIPFKFDNETHLLRVSFYDNMTDKNPVADAVAYEFYANQYYLGFSYEYTDNESVKITAYDGYSKDEIIPAKISGYTVKEISENVFREENSSFIETIVIPSSITKIDNGAFSGCTSLNTVNYTGTQEEWNNISIGEGNNPLTTSDIIFNYTAPVYCNYSYNQRRNTLYIELTNCLTDCLAEIEIFNLTKSELTKEYYEISSGTQNMEIPLSPLNYGEAYRMRCSIVNAADKSVRYTVPYEFADFTPVADTETFMYENFEYRINDNEEIEIVRYYGDAEELVIPDAIDGLPVTALAGDSLCDAYMTVLVAGKSLRYIGDGALTNCYNLRNIIIDSANPYFTFENGVLYNKDKTELLLYLIANYEEHFDMPDSVTVIAPRAFESAYALQTIRFSESLRKLGRRALTYSGLYGELVLPESLEIIGSEALSGDFSKIYIPSATTYIADDAFNNTTQLNEITVSADNSSYSSEDGILYNKDKTKLVKYPSQKTYESFSIPSTVAEVGSYAFSDGADSLNHITLPVNVKIIHDYAFGYRLSLSQVDYTGTETEWNSILTGEYNDSLIYSDINFMSTEPEENPNGRCGDNAFWSIDENGVLTISGTGEIYEWDGSDYTPWSEYNYTKLTVENGITGITANSFAHSGLESVTLAESVTYIGDRAFTQNTNLKTVTATDNLTRIGESAFSECESLESINNTSGLEIIGDYAFNYCSALESITFSSKIKNIGESAFSECINLKGSIVIPETVTYFGDNAFSNCKKISSVTFSAPLPISIGAFSGCDALGEVTFADGVTGISAHAFSRCINLKSVTVPGSVSFIGASAFYECEGLKKVTISEGVAEIGNYAFGFCENITSVSIPGSVKNIEKRAFYSCKGISSLIISEGVTTIGEDAFSSCTGLMTLTIPESVTTIGPNAFRLCTSLANVSLLAKISTLEEYTFASCRSLKSLTLPETLICIGAYAFSYCESLEDIEFPESLTQIDSYAFLYSGLTSIKIPETVTNVNEYAFYGCENLLTADWSATQSIISPGTFYNCSKLKSISFSSSLSQIGNFAFKNCIGLKKIIIPGNIESLSDAAFSDCTGLEALIMHDGVTSIGAETFRNCAGIKYIVIPKSLTQAGYYAFAGCSGLTDIYYKGNETEWEEITFVYPQVSLRHFDNIHFNYRGDDPATERNTNVNITSELDPEYMPQSINEVTIIERGTAYGRFLIRDNEGNPAESLPVVYVYTHDGETVGLRTYTNKYGYVTVEIPDVTESGEYKISFSGEYIQDCEGIVKVTVEPLHFSSGFEAVFKTGASLGVGLDTNVSPVSYGPETKLAEIGIKGSRALGFAFSQEYIDEKNNVVFSSSANNDIAAYGKVGLFSNISENDIPGITVSAADAGFEASVGSVATVGYEDSDFNIKDKDDIENLAKFLIVSSMSNNISNVLAEYIAEKIEAPINYFERGYSVSLEAGAKLGLVEGVESKVTLGGINSKSTWTNTTKKFNDDSLEYTTSLNLEDNAKIFEVEVGVSEATIPVLGLRNISNENLSLSARESGEGDIQSFTLTSSSINQTSHPLNMKTRTDTHTFNFTGDNARAIAYTYDDLRYFGHGNKLFFTNSQLKNATEELLTTNYRGTYSNTDNVSIGKDIDLSVNIEIDPVTGLELGLELGVGGYYNYGYEKQNGILENGIIYMQASNDIRELVEDRILTPEKMVSAAKEKMKALITAVLEKVESWVDETGKTIVASGKAIAKSMKKTAKKYKLYISTTAENLGIARVLAVGNNYALCSTSSVATTIGNPYVINMIDEEGNQVNDFSDEPLLLEIMYTDEDLSAANVTDISQMSILRWDSEKGVYVKAGGFIDTEAQKASLEITVPGQYILGVDNCEPAITLFNQDHKGKNPVISAYISDMSGIAELSLMLDDETVINMDNLDKYYDYTTGLLKYETSLEKSGEYIFTVYAKDTFGNDITQKYSVEINDSTPTIDNVRILDKTVSQAEAVTAEIHGEQLTGVFLNTLVKKASGEAYQLSVDMVEENGIYTANVPVIENASVAEIWVSAYNTYGNKAESEKQICIIDSKAEPAVYIHSISEGNINIECSNLSETGKIHLAIYDKNGVLTGIYSKDITDDTIIFENTPTEGSIKAFAWGDDMIPMCRDFKTNIRQK